MALAPTPIALAPTPIALAPSSPYSPYNRTPIRCVHTFCTSPLLRSPLMARIGTTWFTRISGCLLARACRLRGERGGSREGRTNNEGLREGEM